jgi:two-component system response regulator AtoC
MPPDQPQEYERDYAPLLRNSASMRLLQSRLERVADTDATVLVRGESGVGKEVVARAIHSASPRRAHPFVKVNCAALPADLLESELFGHEKGSFTGAYRRKLGKFEVAHRGTILLDEIAELPVGLQAKLLQVLQDHEFARVGGCDTIRVDVRVLAATNGPLEAAVRAGQFRQDLYYRLKVITLTVPPLRERRDEIPLLAETFLARYNAQYGRDLTLDEHVMTALASYSWPGNVRELENLIKLAVVLEDTRPLLAELNGHPELAGDARARGASAAECIVDAAERRLSLHEVARRATLDAEREAIREALEEAHWNRTEAARILQVSYKALLYKMNQCGLGRHRRAGADVRPRTGPVHGRDTETA